MTEEILMFEIKLLSSINLLKFNSIISALSKSISQKVLKKTGLRGNLFYLKKRHFGKSFYLNQQVSSKLKI